MSWNMFLASQEDCSWVLGIVLSLDGDLHVVVHHELVLLLLYLMTIHQPTSVCVCVCVVSVCAG